MVTVIHAIPGRPTREYAQQMIAGCIDQLYNLFDEHFGLDGSVETWYWMSFPPGAYAPSKDGHIMDSSVFAKAPGGTRWAFGITDDKPPADCPWVLWVVASDPTKADKIDRSPSKRDGVVRVHIDGETIGP